MAAPELSLSPRATPEQRQAILTQDRALVVQAGAGTGKTWVLVQRFLALLENHPDWSLDSIVAVTFTEKAAREMRGRIRRAIEARAADRPDQPIWQSRRRTEANPAFNRPGVPGLLDAVIASQATNNYVNAVLVRLRAGAAPDEVAESIRRWKRLTVYTRSQMEGILIGKLIATSAKQIGMFLAILAIVSAAIVAFIIYTLTMDKIREIAVLKLIGTRNRTIAAMIMQQALALGVIGFAVGKITATFAAPLFPKYVLLMPQDSIAGFFAVLVICALASVIAIRMALKVDPAEAIGG